MKQPAYGAEFWQLTMSSKTGGLQDWNLKLMFYQWSFAIEHSFKPLNDQLTV